MATPFEKPQGSIEVTTPRDKLDRLRAEIQAKGLQISPEKFNCRDVLIKSGESLNTIVTSAFEQNKQRMPASTVELIKLALEVRGVQFSDLRATSWRVERGVLELRSGTQLVFQKNILPWNELHESSDSDVEISSFQYALGKYDGAPENSSEPDVVEAHVDRARHLKGKRSPQWYADKIDATQKMLQLYNSNICLDAQSRALIAPKLTDLNNFVAQSSAPAAFEKKFARRIDELLGADGLLNLILAFQRVLDGGGMPTEKTEVRLRVADDRSVRLVKRTKSVKSGNGNESVIIVVPTGPVKKEEEENVPPKKDDGDAAKKEKPRDSAPMPPIAPFAATSPVIDGMARGGSRELKAEGLASAPTVKAHLEEALNPHVMSTRLLDTYRTDGINALVEGMKKVPPEKRKEVFGTIFERVGSTHPNEAYEIMQAVADDVNSEMRTDLIEGIEATIRENEGNPDVQNFWRLQKYVAAGGLDEGDPNQLKRVFVTMGSVDREKLPPELQEMFDSQKENANFMMRKALALDIVNNGLAVMQSSPESEGDLEDIKELKERGVSDISDRLASGIDRDEEVYFAGEHMFNALKLALAYDYPNHKEIANPIAHYMKAIRDGTLTELTIPDDAFGMSLDKKGFPIELPPGKLKIDDLFTNRAAESELFEQYQRGNEFVFGKRAFLGGGQEFSISQLSPTGEAALIYKQINQAIENLNGIDNYSATLFSKDFFEKDGKMGGVETLQLAKIDHLIEMKRYGEARALCYQIVGPRLLEQKKLNNPENLQKELDRRTAELSKEHLSATVARAQQQLEAQLGQLNTQGNTFSLDDFARMQQREDGSGTKYASAAEFLGAIAHGQLQDQAYDELQDSLGEELFDSNDKAFWGLFGPEGAVFEDMNPFERSIFKKMESMGGYAYTSLSMAHSDKVKKIATAVAEIAATIILTEGVGLFFQGLGGAAELTVGAQGALSAGRGFNLANRIGLNALARSGGAALRTRIAGSGVARFAARPYVGWPLRTLGSKFSSYVQRLSTVPVATPGLTGAARAKEAFKRLMWSAEKNTMMATGFVEINHGLHGEGPVSPFSMEVATTALTFGVLGYTQKFMHGLTPGAQRLTAEVEAAQVAGTAYKFKATDIFARMSKKLGDVNAALASNPTLLNRSQALVMNVSGEVLALHELEKLQAWMTLSETERMAMSDRNEWQAMAETTAVVLGLRGTQFARTRLSEAGVPRPEVTPSDPDAMTPEQQARHDLVQRAGESRDKAKDTLPEPPKPALESTAPSKALEQTITENGLNKDLLSRTIIVPGVKGTSAKDTLDTLSGHYEKGILNTEQVIQYLKDISTLESGGAVTFGHLKALEYAKAFPKHHIVNVDGKIMLMDKTTAGVQSHIAAHLKLTSALEAIPQAGRKSVLESLPSIIERIDNLPAGQSKDIARVILDHPAIQTDAVELEFVKQYLESLGHEGLTIRRQFLNADSKVVAEGDPSIKEVDFILSIKNSALSEDEIQAILKEVNG